MKKLSFLLLFICLQGYSQFYKMDSLGNFYVIEHKLVWQKWYGLEDKAELNKMLKANNFTSDLDILKFTNSTKTKHGITCSTECSPHQSNETGHR